MIGPSSPSSRASPRRSPCCTRTARGPAPGRTPRSRRRFGSSSGATRRTPPTRPRAWPWRRRSMAGPRTTGWGWPGPSVRAAWRRSWSSRRTMRCAGAPRAWRRTPCWSLPASPCSGRPTRARRRALWTWPPRRQWPPALPGGPSGSSWLRTRPRGRAAPASRRASLWGPSAPRPPTLSGSSTPCARPTTSTSCGAPACATGGRDPWLRRPPQWRRRRRRRRRRD